MGTQNQALPKVAVDTVVLTVDEGQLKVLLLQISGGPYDQKWAVPGGLLAADETSDQAAKRVLLHKTNIVTPHLEQLYTFSQLDRDLRDRSISIAYFLLINNPKLIDIKTQGHYSQIAWTSVQKLPKMAFDHQQIIETALKRLRDKTTYSTIAYALLPEIFTLSQMQGTYEIILNRKLDKRNFRKRVLQLGILEKSGKIIEGSFRPSKTYHFSKKEIQYFT